MNHSHKYPLKIHPFVQFLQLVISTSLTQVSADICQHVRAFSVKIQPKIELHHVDRCTMCKYLPVKLIVDELMSREWPILSSVD